MQNQNTHNIENTSNTENQNDINNSSNTENQSDIDNSSNTENQNDINNSSNTENQSDIDSSSNTENQSDINNSSNTDQLGNTSNSNRNNSFTYTFILEHIASLVTFFTGAIMLYNLLIAESKSIFYNLPNYYFIDINQVRTFRVILVILCIFLFIYENFIHNVNPKLSELLVCFVLILLFWVLPIYFIFSLVFYVLVLIFLIIVLLKDKERHDELNYKQVIKIIIKFISYFIFFIIFTFIIILLSHNKILFFDNKKYEVIQGIKNWQVIITEHGDGKILVMTGVESEDENDTEKRFLTINTKEGYKIIERNDEQVIKHVTYDKVNVSEGAAVNDCTDAEIDKIKDLISIMEEETPEIKYMDMEEALLEFYTKPIKDDYKFLGRFSNNGYAYILGISKTENPPLRDLDSWIGKTGYIQMKKNVYDQIGNDDSSEDIYDFPGILSFYQGNDGKYIYLGIKQYSDFEDISGDTKYSGMNLGEVFNEIVNKNRLKYISQLHEKQLRALKPFKAPYISMYKLEDGESFYAYKVISYNELNTITEDNRKVNSSKINIECILLYDFTGEVMPCMDCLNQTLYEKVRDFFEVSFLY